MADPRNATPPHRPSIGVLSEDKVVRKESSDNYSKVLVQFLSGD